MDPQTVAYILAQGGKVPSEPPFGSMLHTLAGHVTPRDTTSLLAGQPDPSLGPSKSLMPPSGDPRVQGAMGEMPQLAAGALAPETKALDLASTMAPGMANAVPTGKSQWDLMLENWGRREKDIKSQIEAERTAIKKIEDPITQKASGLRRPGTPRGDNDAAALAAMQQAAKAQTDPARARITALEAQLEGLGKERVMAQTPMRQAHPMAAFSGLVGAGGMAALGGYGLGRWANKWDKNKADLMTEALKRNTEHVGATSTKTGAPGANTYMNPEGISVVKELSDLTGKAPNKWALPMKGAAIGGAFGGAESALPQLGYTGMDSMLSPTGSPLQQNSSLLDKFRHPVQNKDWWDQMFNESAVGVGLGAAGGIYGANRGGPPKMPYPEVNAASLGANTIRADQLRKAAAKEAKSAGKVDPLANLPNLKGP